VIRKAYAYSRLAGLYARHIARRAVPYRRRESGLDAFIALYTPDRLTPISPAERAALPEHGRCVGCGLCGMAAAPSGYARPERLPLQLTRHLPDLWATRDLDLDGVDWAAAAAVCPMGVPLPAMRDLVRGRLAADGTAPPVPRRLEPLPG
jgi:hypothetical protein